MANFPSDHSAIGLPSTVHGVTIRLTVRRADWLAHVHGVADVTPGLVPVVKGNGYGFRRWNLMEIAGELSREVAVGTVFEVRDTPSHLTPIDSNNDCPAKKLANEYSVDCWKPSTCCCTYPSTMAR